MKTILFIRHAKSAWNDATLSDFERILSPRGKSDAKMMAERLRKKGIQIDLFVSSSAKRAKETAEIFMQKFESGEKELKLLPSLYEPLVNNFYEAIENLSDEEETVALFSHNPGITHFVNSLDCAPVYEMPTTSVYAVKINTDHWKEFRIAKKVFLFFDDPKNES